MFNRQESWKLQYDQITWLQKAVAIPGKGPLKLALAILAAAINDERYDRIILYPTLLEDHNLSRNTAYRATGRLKRAGLITVKRTKGRSPEVAIVEEGDVPTTPEVDPILNWQSLPPCNWEETSNTAECAKRCRGVNASLCPTTYRTSRLRALIGYGKLPTNVSGQTKKEALSVTDPKSIAPFPRPAPCKPMDSTATASLPMRRRDPAQVAACELRFRGGQHTLLELECRVLARQSNAIIAVAMEFDEQVVSAYCSLFFRVAPHLDALQYILYRVIGIKPNAAPRDFQFVMLAAYQHGPISIEFLLDWFDHRHELHDLTTEVGRMREKIEQLFLIQSLPNNESSNKVMLRWLAVQSKVERMLVPERTVHQVIGENVTKMLSEITSGSKESPPHTDPPSSGVQHQAAQQSEQINELHQAATVS